MTDVLTKKPITVSRKPIGGPFLNIPLLQLPEIRRLLDAHNVYYWVSQNAISINGSPMMIYVRFGRKGDAEAIQRILDAA